MHVRSIGLVGLQLVLLLGLLGLPFLGGCGCGGDPALPLPAIFEAPCMPAEWLVSSRGDEGVHDAVALTDGTHFVSGWMSGWGTQFGPTGAAKSLPTDETYRAPYVTKFERSGTLAWRAYGVSPDTNYEWRQTGLAPCEDGGCVLSATYRGDKRFRDGVGALHALPAAPDWTVGVMRFDPAGRLMWVQQATAFNSIIFGHAVACDENGQIVVAGGADHGASFGGPADGGRTTLLEPGGWLGYVWIIDRNGQTRSVSGGFVGSASSAASRGFVSARADGHGGVWLTAVVNTEDVVLIDGTRIGGGGAGEFDGLVTHWDLARGTANYAERFATVNSNHVRLGEVAPAPGGDLYVALEHDGDVRLPDGRVLVRPTTLPPYRDSASLIRVDATLSVARWWRTVQTDHGSWMGGVTLASLDSTEDGDVVAAYSHPPRTELAPRGPGDSSTLLSRSSSRDASVIRFRPSGELRFAHTDGGDGDDAPARVRALPGGSTLVVGQSSGNPEFAIGTLLYTRLYAGGSRDVWRYVVMDDGYSKCPASALASNGYGYGR